MRRRSFPERPSDSWGDISKGREESDKPFARMGNPKTPQRELAYRTENFIEGGVTGGDTSELKMEDRTRKANNTHRKKERLQPQVDRYMK